MLDGAIMRAEVTSDNMYSNIDLAIPKLEKQIIRHHKKIESKTKKLRVKDFSAIPDDVPEVEIKEEKTLVRSKCYTLIPMSVDDAIEERQLRPYRNCCVATAENDGRPSFLFVELAVYSRQTQNIGVFFVQNTMRIRLILITDCIIMYTGK